MFLLAHPSGWDLLFQWIASGFTSSNVVTAILSAAALVVSWRAFVRSKPRPPEQPVLRASTQSSAEAPWAATVNKNDGTVVHVSYRSRQVAVLNAGPVAAHDVDLHLSGTKYQMSQEWRLGKIDPEDRPTAVVPLTTSDDAEDTDPPRVWITWTEFPGSIPRSVEVDME